MDMLNATVTTAAPSSPAVDDAALAKAAAAGDVHAYERIYRRHAPKLNALLWRMELRASATFESLDARDDGMDHLSEMAAPARCHATGMDLERALQTLPPRARAVLVLHDIEGWKHQEIATELQMAVGSSKAQLHRARGLLRVRLGEVR
ncbi:ECF RNA polymerase sigma factor SigE [compost metagenome]